MFEDNTEKRLLEKCAQLATWHFLENDPVEKERLAERIAAEVRASNYQGLANQARMEAAEEHNEHQQHESGKEQAEPGIEADSDYAYEQAAKELDAEPIKDGQEIEGEVVDVAQVDGQNYYVIEQDGERLAVPAGDKPEYEKGDEITVSRTKEGFETGDSYGYEYER